jgi:hypothetical protein
MVDLVRNEKVGRQILEHHRVVVRMDIGLHGGL